MNFETQNTNGPPHFSVSCDNRPTKDCRTMLRFSLGFLVQKIHEKYRGGPRGPYAATPPSARWRVKCVVILPCMVAVVVQLVVVEQWLLEPSASNWQPRRSGNFFLHFRGVSNPFVFYVPRGANYAEFGDRKRR